MKSIYEVGNDETTGSDLTELSLSQQRSRLKPDIIFITGVPIAAIYAPYTINA